MRPNPPNSNSALDHIDLNAPRLARNSFYPVPYRGSGNYRGEHAVDPTDDGNKNLRSAKENYPVNGQPKQVTPLPDPSLRSRPPIYRPDKMKRLQQATFKTKRQNSNVEMVPPDSTKSSQANNKQLLSHINQGYERFQEAASSLKTKGNADQEMRSRERSNQQRPKPGSLRLQQRHSQKAIAQASIVLTKRGSVSKEMQQRTSQIVSGEGHLNMANPSVSFKVSRKHSLAPSGGAMSQQASNSPSRCRRQSSQVMSQASTREEIPRRKQVNQPIVDQARINSLNSLSFFGKPTPVNSGFSNVRPKPIQPMGSGLVPYSCQNSSRKRRDSSLKTSVISTPRDSPRRKPQKQNLVEVSKKIQIRKEFLQFQQHPSLYLSRQTTTDVERQNINVQTTLGEDIDRYLKDYEAQIDLRGMMDDHPQISTELRARMVDWMVEVLTNFKCDDLTFFIAVNIMDRYLKATRDLPLGDLHIVGVTAMFVASKFEDIFPLKMKTVHEKVAHCKLSIESIKSTELQMLKAIRYKIHTPTVLDFLKYYLKAILNISIANRTDFKEREANALAIVKNKSEGVAVSAEDECSLRDFTIGRMAIYLAKLCMHDAPLSTRRPSHLAIGVIYVALKILEQLKKQTLITIEFVSKLQSVGQVQQEEIVEVSSRVLELTQNVEKELPNLENLKNSHFNQIKLFL